MRHERLSSDAGEPLPFGEVDVNLDPLFEPFASGSLTLRNRFVMPAMTRSFSQGGVLSSGAPDYYGRRANGGAGLIITEGTAVSHPVSDETDRIPDLRTDAARAMWRKVVDRVHGEGSAIFLQLWHAGLLRKAAMSRNPGEASIGASATVAGLDFVGRSATTSDIEAIVDAFARDADTSKSLGFDGIEIHGAHGYLIDQFLSLRANARGDDYSGSIENRVRLAVEVVAAIRRRVGPGFPIGFRFSQWKAWDYNEKAFASPDELGRFLSLLVHAGVDLFHVSTRRFWEPAFGGSDLTLAGWTRRLSGKPSITVGAVGLAAPLRVGESTGGTPTDASPDNLGVLAKLFAGGEFELVAVGRGFLANANWAQAVHDQTFGELRAYAPVDERRSLDW